jgi:hypothetical protein
VIGYDVIAADGASCEQGHMPDKQSLALSGGSSMLRDSVLQSRASKDAK